MTKTIRLIAGSCLLLVSGALSAQVLMNADFEATTGSWADGEGPPGWTLNLGSDMQRGLVEAHDFVEHGSNAFRFNQVASGFGSSRLEQCLELGDAMAHQLSTWVRADDPHPELAVRLRMDFYADADCGTDSLNADAEQIQTDIGLSSDRAPARQWVRLDSEVRLAGELGDDVRSVRISLRQRDRSNEGQPRIPARTVWFDRVSTTTDVQFLPATQRAALRELYLATGGDSWQEALGWMEAEGTECHWQGVECSSDGSRLLRLSLPRNGLLGNLPESLAEMTDLLPGEGLDLCWNDVLVPKSLEAFVNQHHLGGDPGHCQGLVLKPIHAGLSGSYFQPDGRYGEGIVLDMLSAGSAVLMWATYNNEGEPVWLIATGRAHDRVLQFEDIHHTHINDNQVAVERVGRGSLVFEADPERPGCNRAVFRFHVHGPTFAADSGRVLQYLDGRSSCIGHPEPLPLLNELDGNWFDPDQSGQGLGLTPVNGNALWLNWYSYDEHGQQIWQAGAGWPDASGERIVFDPLYTVSGGNFDGHMDADDLDIEYLEPAELVWNDGRWQFESSWQGEPVLLRLEKIQPGPDLLASTGNRIDLTMNPADLHALYSRPVWSDERIPGQIHFNGEEQIHELTGLRFRGRSSRMVPKKSFNIRFEQAQPLLFGSDRMNLNSMWTDPAMMREALSFDLFHQLGRPAPRTRYFDLWINGVYEGTYLHIQRIDDHLLALHGFNPNGTLVRDQLRDSLDHPAESAFNNDYSGMSEEERLTFIASHYDYRGDPAWPSLLALIEWVQSTPAGPAYAAGLAERFDVDGLIDWMVLHWLIGDTDGFGDDYWLYLDHDNPAARWKIIPWDKDLTFGTNYREGFFTDNDFFHYEYPIDLSGWQNALLQKLMATPALRRQAESRLLELIDEELTEARLNAQIDTLHERLTDSIGITAGPLAFNVHPANHHSQPELQEEQIEAIRDFIQLRYQFIRTRLPAPAGNQQDQAEKTITAGSDEITFLTDQTGFTLATVRPLEPFAESTGLDMVVSERPELRGIDREWQLEVGSGGGPVELSLYYRNEVSIYWGRGNWWTEGDEPVGRQRELQLTVIGPDGAEQILDTRINPISNKAVAELTLVPGLHVLTLSLP